VLGLFEPAIGATLTGCHRSGSCRWVLIPDSPRLGPRAPGDRTEGGTRHSRGSRPDPGVVRPKAGPAEASSARSGVGRLTAPTGASATAS
jgi:hypothetical protein